MIYFQLSDKNNQLNWIVKLDSVEKIGNSNIKNQGNRDYIFSPLTIPFQSIPSLIKAKDNPKRRKYSLIIYAYRSNLRISFRARLRL
jgi:hypothetical protein